MATITKEIGDRDKPKTVKRYKFVGEKQEGYTDQNKQMGLELYKTNDDRHKLVVYMQVWRENITRSRLEEISIYEIHTLLACKPENKDDDKAHMLRGLLQKVSITTLDSEPDLSLDDPFSPLDLVEALEHSRQLGPII